MIKRKVISVSLEPKDRDILREARDLIVELAEVIDEEDYCEEAVNILEDLIGHDPWEVEEDEV